MSLEEQRSESGKETGALLRSWDNSSLEEDTPKQGHPSRCCCHLDHNRRRSRLSFQCSAILLASLALLILILVLTVPSWFRTSSTGARHLRPDTPGLNKCKLRTRSPIKVFAKEKVTNSNAYRFPARRVYCHLAAGRRRGVWREHS